MRALDFTLELFYQGAARESSWGNQDFVLVYLFYRSRSSRPEVFCKKGVLKNFAKFTGKHLCQSLFF